MRTLILTLVVLTAAAALGFATGQGEETTATEGLEVNPRGCIPSSTNR